MGLVRRPLFKDGGLDEYSAPGEMAPDLFLYRVCGFMWALVSFNHVYKCIVLMLLLLVVMCLDIVFNLF